MKRLLLIVLTSVLVAFLIGVLEVLLYGDARPFPASLANLFILDRIFGKCDEAKETENSPE